MAVDYLLPLIDQLERNANPAEAESMSRYMRNQFPFYGIKTPKCRIIFRQFLAEHGLPPPEMIESVTLALWERPQRECHYITIGLLERVSKRQPTPLIDLIETLIVRPLAGRYASIPKVILMPLSIL